MDRLRILEPGRHRSKEENMQQTHTVAEHIAGGARVSVQSGIKGWLVRLVRLVIGRPVVEAARRAPAPVGGGATGNLRRIAELHALGACPMDEAFLCVLADLASEAGAIAAVLELAQQAHGAIEDALLHPGWYAGSVDVVRRRALASNLSEALQAIGVAP